MPQISIADTSFPVQAILFDKDGTLLDFIYTWGYWGEQLLARFSRELEARKLPPLAIDTASLWGIYRAADGTIDRYDRNGPLAMGTVDDILTLLTWQGYRSGLSWAEAAVLAAACRQAADEQLEQGRIVKAIPGAISFLEQCRSHNIPLAIVTADETEAAIKHLEWLGIGHYFSACIGTDLVERGKPFPDMVELACRELSVECSKVAVIGDTNGDMRMAKSAGAAAAIGIAAANEEAGLHLPDADMIISAYHELVIRESEA